MLYCFLKIVPVNWFHILKNTKVFHIMVKKKIIFSTFFKTWLICQEFFFYHGSRHWKWFLFKKFFFLLYFSPHWLSPQPFWFLDSNFNSRFELTGGINIVEHRGGRPVTPACVENKEGSLYICYFIFYKNIYSKVYFILYWTFRNVWLTF